MHYTRYFFLNAWCTRSIPYIPHFFSDESTRSTVHDTYRCGPTHDVRSTIHDTYDCYVATHDVRSTIHDTSVATRCTMHFARYTEKMHDVRRSEHDVTLLLTNNMHVADLIAWQLWKNLYISMTKMKPLPATKFLWWSWSKDTIFLVETWAYVYLSAGVQSKYF